MLKASWYSVVSKGKLNVNFTFSLFSEGEEQAIIESKGPVMHTGLLGNVVSGGKVMKSVSEL